jgi:hypothetical protein
LCHLANPSRSQFNISSFVVLVHIIFASDTVLLRKPTTTTTTIIIIIITTTTTTIIIILSLKPEWKDAPLVQEKYQGKVKL